MKSLILDVDGVVSPVVSPVAPASDRFAWGDEVVAGELAGHVWISPTLCRHLDALGAQPDLTCAWLTSWTAEMRESMHPFPGRVWPTVAEPANTPGPGRGWWKLAALEAWLSSNPEIGAVAWCDDHLRGRRPGAIRRRLLAERDLDVLLIAPRTDQGLTPDHLRELAAWAR